jgi:putative peptidoglycan lipid II flippase
MDTLGFFALSLFAQALIPLQVRVFYARHDSRTPFYIGLATVVVNIFLSLWLSKILGVAGLALAFSVANILNFILLWIWLYARIGALDQKRILISTAKFSVAGIVAGLAIQQSKNIIGLHANMQTFGGVFLQLTISAVIGLLVYILVCCLIRSEELLGFLALVKRKLPFRKIKMGDQGEARGI